MSIHYGYHHDRHPQPDPAPHLHPVVGSTPLGLPKFVPLATNDHIEKIVFVKLVAVKKVNFRKTSFLVKTL